MDKSFEIKQLKIAAWSCIPSCLLATYFLWASDWNVYLKSLISIFLLSATVFHLYSFYDKLKDQFISLANLVEALNVGDYSLRAKVASEGAGHSDLVNQINRLADSLTSARYDYKESQLLLAKLLKQVGVVIFACDEKNHITMANPAAEAFFSKPESKLVNLSLTDLDVSSLIDAKSNQVILLNINQSASRWHLFKNGFRDQGKQHNLFILSDMETVLSRQEQKAWKDLVRVLSHEINNSLSPIISLTSTLNKLTSTFDLDDDNKSDFQGGLTIIGERAARLNTFIKGYRQLASLPEPNKQPHDLVKVVQNTCELLGYAYEFNKIEACLLEFDAAQLEQCLINIIKNAYEANSQIPFKVTLSKEGDFAVIAIRDFGPGVSNPDNLFVPLYTTKKQGTGIGLALCRQIVLGHNGHISLDNHPEGGCHVQIKIPLS